MSPDRLPGAPPFRVLDADGPEQRQRDEFYAALAAPGVDHLAALDRIQGYDVFAEPI